ncbi:hypothetical protein I4U23_023301 [Adineta vaga]|nr:hypothetical protein I4U23_023301 [Adineta vaga]
MVFKISPVSESIEHLFRELHNRKDHQAWGKIVCYTTLKCNYGLLCLDWRNICDGAQNCIDGIDEENCDKLEFNECEDDEYRCVNGMCIPQEYWIDGQRDCMDWSDEMDAGLGDFCPFHPLTIDCDDHKCISSLWSCGDGQCINTFARHVYQKFSSKEPGCYTMREYSYICETAADMALWTKPDGLCVWEGYRDRSIDFSSNTNICMYLIRCALSKGAEARCPCNGSNCITLMHEVCLPNKMYLYPRNGIIRPWLAHGYDWNQRWSNPSPNFVLFVGTIRCRGFRVNKTFADMHQFIYTYELIDRFLIESSICAAVPIEHRDTKSPNQFSATCWHDSSTFNSRPYAFQDICSVLGGCFSQYRIGDGVIDCVNNSDEVYDLLSATNYCQKIQKHRFQCSSEQRTCFPVMMFANQYPNQHRSCANNYDKFLKGNGRVLYKINCMANDDNNECHLLRTYIGNSSIHNLTYLDHQDESNDNHQSTVIPFPYYCDTFWDEQQTHIDEHPMACQTWICHDNQFRCRTGQCIEASWVCDGEWDCSDASDEFGLSEYWSDNSERNKKCQERYATLPFPDLCNFTYEYPCYRSSVSNPKDIYTYRPCINLTQLGDGIEDCYGGIDEKNTFKDCTENMLGYTLRCADQCTTYSFACANSHKCTNSLLCSHRSKNASWCFETEDVVCLDGTCRENARCNGKRQCPDGEDEHWCSPHDSLGDNCTEFHSECSIYCSSDSICRPNQRGLIAGSDYPLCICPFGRLGSRCHIRNEACYTNPCGLDSTCHLTNDPSGEDPFVCICAKQFYGDRCQFEKIAIRIEINMTSISIVSSVIQFYDFTLPTMILHLVYQQVLYGLPQTVRYNHGENIVPPIAILKTYDKITSPTYSILYLRQNASNINITSTPEKCPHVSNLFSQEERSRIPTVFEYHHICRNDTARICFYDSNYLCLCQPEHKGVHCFVHDPFIDHCDLCLSGGKCIKGDVKNSNDFICLCPSCHEGYRCEFSLQAFGFTLDSLLISYTTTVQSIYISLVLGLFILGLFTNFCSFLTFKRAEPRKFGVGNYLLVVTILNQCGLFCLLFKFIHVLLGSLGRINNMSLPVYSQTCHGTSLYGQCSSNSACGCFPMTAADDFGVCGFLWVSCSRLTPCKALDDTCDKPEHICVHHPRCHSAPVCYPLLMINQQICPPSNMINTTTTTTSSTIETTSITATSTIMTTSVDTTTTTSSLRPKDGICATATWSKVGITVADDNQNIYIADTLNDRVVKWKPNVTTGEIVAGGNGKGKERTHLNSPRDIIVDKAETVYVTDYSNGRIQRWVKNAYRADTILNASSPIGVAIDDEGSLYAMSTGSTLLKQTKAQGNWTTIGTRSKDVYLNPPFDPYSAITDQSGDIYVVERNNHRVTRWKNGAATGPIIAGGSGSGSSSTHLYSPSDLAFDHDGNLYVVDSGNHRVQKFTIDKSSCH